MWTQQQVFLITSQWPWRKLTQTQTSTQHHRWLAGTRVLPLSSSNNIIVYRYSVQHKKGNNYKWVTTRAWAVVKAWWEVGETKCGEEEGVAISDKAAGRMEEYWTSTVQPHSRGEPGGNGWIGNMATNAGKRTDWSGPPAVGQWFVGGAGQSQILQ